MHVNILCMYTYYMHGVPSRALRRPKDPVVYCNVKSKMDLSIGSFILNESTPSFEGILLENMRREGYEVRHGGGKGVLFRLVEFSHLNDRCLVCLCFVGM